MIDIATSDVPALELRPRFFRDDGGQDFVEISAVGGRDTVIHKVKPEHMARFSAAWEAYQDGREMPLRKGTPLTDLPQITAELAKTFIERGVHNLEEISILSDAQCQGLGHGTLNLRRQARELVETRKANERTRMFDKISESASPVSAPSGEVAALSAKVDQLATQMQSFLEAMTAAQQPKRKKSNGAEPAADSQ